MLSVALLTGAILLAGCASVYSDRVQGVPTEAADLELDLDQVDPPPFVVWAANGEDWLLVTWGSSSCPNAPASVVETAPGNFTIELKREGGPICTADMGPTTFRLPAPDGATDGDGVVLNIGPGVEQELDAAK